VILRRLATRNFRNLADGELQFHPAANVIVGDNGQGKTNLLEAIYFLATTKSFRTPRTTNLVRTGAPDLFVHGVIETGGLEKYLSIGLSAESERRRELRVNEERVGLQKYVTVLQLFAYSAARLEILRGGPEERRRFLDRGIAGLHPGYLADLNRYGRALQQRNALLSGGNVGLTLLDTWDEELALAGAPIIRARSSYASLLDAEFHRIAAEHDYHVTETRMRYTPNGFETDGTLQRDAVRALRRRELDAGFTLWGPHRDLMAFELDGKPATDILSSGEIKMTVLFLKFAKLSLYRSQFEQPAVFLLDDVDAELDLGIIERLLVWLGGTTQLFTSSAKESMLPMMRLGHHRRIYLKNGRVTETSDSR
jgi:DNA replication and repair protein RecF